MCCVGVCLCVYAGVYVVCTHVGKGGRFKTVLGEQGGRERAGLIQFRVESAVF